jgi:thiamine biosynthesis lipoprotein
MAGPICYSPMAMSRLRKFVAAAALTGLLAGCGEEKTSHAWFAMDTDFSAIVYSQDDQDGQGKVGHDSAFAALERESARLEAVFSDFLPASDLEKITGRAGDTLVVDAELALVLGAAAEMAEASGGSFDVTLHRLKRAWGLATGDTGSVPDTSEIAAAMRGNPVFKSGPGDHPEEHPPYRLLDGNRLVVLRDSLSLDLGGIAKGYAVDRMHAMLDSMGFPTHLVQAGGDMRLGGHKDGPWRVGIRHPRRPDTVGGSLTLPHPLAISTSGDYERFFIQDSVRYHHIFNPRTGRPARPYCSVTVITSTSLGADALTKPLFVLGPEKGLPLLARFHAEALWVRDDAGALCAISSPGMAGKLETVFPPCDDKQP